jgi:sarcosine oxidase subunit alpha
VLQALIGTEPPRHMSAISATVAGLPVLVLGASYSGERAFEVYVEASRALPMWTALAAGVENEGGCLYGLDAMDLLRIEKGHVLVGGEIDGRMTPHDLGLDGMLNKAGGFTGAAGLQRPALGETGRLQLVGLEALDGAIPEGAMLIPASGQPPQGHVTGAGRHVLREGAIALGLLTDGRARHGEELLASSPTRGVTTRMRVASPHFYDAAGALYRD